MTYDQGSTVRCATNVTRGGFAADPDILHFVCLQPDGTSLRYTWPGDANVVHSGLGIFSVDVIVSQAGVFYYRFYSDGAEHTSEQSAFVVSQDTLT